MVAPPGGLPQREQQIKVLVCLSDHVTTVKV